ncbi:MAG TPA: OmpA family protein [Acidiferrobacterales bacterium]|nr:OmpA family protein [Acidiferrobacterales bacterium]
MKNLRITITLSMIAMLGLGACVTDEFGNPRPYTDAEKGALIGAASGAVLGGAVSKKKNRTQGVLIGAVGGGLAGGAVGTYMDSQKKDLEKALAPERNAGAIQVEKLPQNALRVTMTDQTAFTVDSAEIKPRFYSTMDKISTVLNRYGKTELTIVGHTDSTGTTQHNQALSERRAQAVETYFSQKGVVSQRLESQGLGESAPRASNATAEGRQLNRRVEIIIEPVLADQPG